MDLAEWARTRKLDVALLHELGWADDPEKPGWITIPYPVAMWDRPSTIRRRRLDDGPGARFLSEPGSVPVPYDPWLAGPSADLLFITEGETDAVTLLHYDVYAVGLPGAGSATEAARLWAYLWDGCRRVVLALDNDGPGQAASATLLARLPKAVELGIPAGYKDVNEWHCADSPSLKEAVEKCRLSKGANVLPH